MKREHGKPQEAPVPLSASRSRAAGGAGADGRASAWGDEPVAAHKRGGDAAKRSSGQANRGQLRATVSTDAPFGVWKVFSQIDPPTEMPRYAISTV